MDIEKIISEMTFEEKAKLLTGGEGAMKTFALERFGIESIACADGPHGTRLEKEKNCTHFPNLCNLGASWDVDLAKKMGNALADDCIHNGISMLLGPGINIKRLITCGRNFEYISEDPVLSGEMCAGYINGLQEKGVSACLKHYAVNNQEKDRCDLSADIDERTMREIYLKGFEIAVKKSKPDSIMCAYNKVNAVWCSENEFLLKKALKEDMQFEGIVVSDWGAVHNISRSVRAGLDLQMPYNSLIAEQLKDGLDKGLVSMEDIDAAVRRMLKFLDRKPLAQINYDRDAQHKIAREIAADGVVMLKNDNQTLPITAEKYKKVAVVGEFAVSPLIAGQGSAEVLQSEEYTDSPLEELKKRLPDVEIKYFEMFKKASYSETMLWPTVWPFYSQVQDCDVIIVFAGSMISEDTENFDRRTPTLNPNYDMFINAAIKTGKKVVVVLQNGGGLIFDEWHKKVDSILEMWLAGEAAGGAIADVICGAVNPSGKLSETFPKIMRNDFDYPGDGIKVEYNERLNVGYRYYDKHPDEILYPFGHGISYTDFKYGDLEVSYENQKATVSFTLENVGDFDGAEVVQLYIGDPVCNVVRPIKELKQFKKVFLNKGSQAKVEFVITADDLSYYNTIKNMWVAENGQYDIYIGASSRDIKLQGSFVYQSDEPYTTKSVGTSMIG